MCECGGGGGRWEGIEKGREGEKMTGFLLGALFLVFLAVGSSSSWKDYLKKKTAENVEIGFLGVPLFVFFLCIRRMLKERSIQDEDE